MFSHCFGPTKDSPKNFGFHPDLQRESLLIGTITGLYVQSHSRPLPPSPAGSCGDKDTLTNVDVRLYFIFKFALEGSSALCPHPLLL